MRLDLDAAGPEQIRDGFTTGADAATGRAGDIGQIAASMTEIADRYADLGMATSTLTSVRAAAARYTTAAATLHGAGEDLQAALTDFDAHDGLVAAAAADTGNLAAADILTGDGAPGTAGDPGLNGRSPMTATPAADVAADLDEDTAQRLHTELTELTQLAADLAERLNAFAASARGRLDPAITGAAIGGYALCREVADDLAGALDQLQIDYADELGFYGSVDTGGWYLNDDTSGPYLDWSSVLSADGAGSVEMGDGSDAVVIELDAAQLAQLRNTLAGILDGDPSAGGRFTSHDGDHLTWSALNEDGICTATMADARTPITISVTEQQLRAICAQLSRDIEDLAATTA